MARSSTKTPAVASSVRAPIDCGDDDDMPTLSAGLAASVESDPRRNRRSITLLTGEGSGRVLRLGEREVVCGSASDTDLCLPDSSVSRRHARFFCADDEAWVQDLASTNGTFVRGERITGPVRLHDGDQVQLGPDRVLRYSLRDILEEDAAFELYDSSVRDSTSGAFNRRHFDERLGAELAFAARGAQPLALLLLDIDEFKGVNDAHGHLVGDKVLGVLTANIQRMLRPTDSLFRYGGDELVVLCRGTTLRNGMILADRIRASVAQLPLTLAGNDLHVSVSIGVAASLGADPAQESLVARADRALLEAKARRQVEHAPPPR